MAETSISNHITSVFHFQIDCPYPRTLVSCCVQAYSTGDKIFADGACGKCTPRTRGLGAFAGKLLEVVHTVTELQSRGLIQAFCHSCQFVTPVQARWRCYDCPQSPRKSCGLKLPAVPPVVQRGIWPTRVHAPRANSKTGTCSC